MVRVVRMYLRAAARTFRLHNRTHRSHLTLRINNDLSSLCRNGAASAWRQQAAHENHIGTVPVRRRKRTKFVLLIKTDIARPLSGDDVDARTSRARGLRGKRGDQSGANTAITVAVVEIDVQMARIAIAQWRKRRIIAVIGKPWTVRRIVQTTREISGHRTDFGNGDEEALDVIRNVAPQPALLERLALVRPQGLCRRTGSKENLLDRRQPGLPIRLIHQANDTHDKGPRITGR